MNSKISYIEINLTELCDRKCSFCPRSSGYPNHNLNLSVTNAKKIKTQIEGCIHLQELQSMKKMVGCLSYQL